MIAPAAPHTVDSRFAARQVGRWGIRFTPTGFLYLAVLVLVGLAAFNSEANLLLLVFGIGIGVALLSISSGVRTVRRIEVERIVPEAAVAGRPFRLVYVVRNRRRWTRGWCLRIGELPVRRGPSPFRYAFIPVLGPGVEERLEVLCTWPDRGRVQLEGVRISSGFPFGLFHCYFIRPAPLDLIVYPAVGRMRRDIWRQADYAEAQADRKAARGSGQDEFYGVREYRQGDNPRWIHWRRSAHTGQLVVREHAPIRCTHLIVLLDPWPEDTANGSGDRWRSRLLLGRGGRQPPPDPGVERTISAAATAVCDALERGHRVGLICRADVPIVIPPSGGRPHRQRLLHHLALLAPGAEQSLEDLVAGVRWSSGWFGRCLLFTPRLSKSQSHVLQALTSRTQSLTAVAPETGWLDKLFEPLGEPAGDRRGR